MKVYLARNSSVKYSTKVILFYVECVDLKHCNLEWIKTNEDIDRYFESGPGKLKDTIQVVAEVGGSPYKRLGNKPINKIKNYFIRSKRTGQNFGDYTILREIDVDYDILMDGFNRREFSSDEIQRLTKKNTFKLHKYIRYRWLKKNGLTIIEPMD